MPTRRSLIRISGRRLFWLEIGGEILERESYGVWFVNPTIRNAEARTK